MWNLDETAVRIVPAGERGWTKKAASARVFASRAFVTVTLAANMRGGMWTQIIYEASTLRRNFAASCATPAAHQIVLRSVELHGIHSAAGPVVHARLQELDPPRGSQTLRQILFWKSSPTSNMSIWTPVPQCSASCCFRAHSSRQPTTSNCWLEQRELLAEEQRLPETGELFPRGTAEEPHAPDAEAEASDSEPDAHVMEHHSSDGEDTPPVSRNQRHQRHQRLPLLQREQP